MEYYQQKMSRVKNTSLCSFSQSIEIFTESLVTVFDFLRLVFTFSAAMFLPQILRATLTSSTDIGQYLIWLLLITHLKYFQDG